MNPELGDQEDSNVEDMSLEEIANKFYEFKEQFDGTFSSQNSANPGYNKVYELLRDNGWLPRVIKKADKSNEASARSRTDGNRSYVAKKNEQAFIEYSQAVCQAHRESEEISLAFANRSAVTFNHKRYDDALNDIKQALSNVNYPEHLKHKLYKRRGQCYLALLQYSKALEDFKSAQAFLQLHSDFESVKSSMSQIDSLIGICQDKSDMPQSSAENMQLSHEPSSYIQSASAAVDIRFSAEYGRHIVANTEIMPGDVVAIEKAYVSVLRPDQDWEYVRCNKCKKTCYSMVPCLSCNTVMFCSEDCRLASWETYHSIECAILPTLDTIATEEHVMWKTLLALRILLVASKYGKDLTSLMKDGDIPDSRELSGFVNGKYLSDDYTPVDCLSTNLKRRDLWDVITLAVYATCLVHILKEGTKFFEDCLMSTPSGEQSFADKDSSVKNLSSVDLAVADLLFRYMMIARINACYLSEVVEVGGPGFPSGADMGAGIFPFYSLFSHSCDPNVAHFNYKGDTILMFAVQPIRKGEQLFEDYGYNFNTDRRHDRQVLLERHYHFTCKCPACVNYWPNLHLLPKLPILKRSSTDRSILRLADCFENIILEVSKGRGTEKHLEFIRRFMILAHENLELPWQPYGVCQDALKCYILRKALAENFRLHSD